MKPTFFETAAEWRAWLAKHHASETELLVGFHKKTTGYGITYQEALDEALAYGWIDGVRKRLDDTAYRIRFTPRKPGSVWSVVNTKRVEELIAQKRMKTPGLRAFEQRDANKTAQYSYEREQSKLDSALEAKLRANAKAAAFFDAQPPGYRKIITHWVMSAKQEETRARRMEKLIEHSAKGARIDFMKPVP
ncbi:MAG TPA: YdeI/OmpD-associated family protein [Candidatus Solibacter sp.]|nr:YdeI/OmpD-associated family protein [Candidatus Solibacter sp.]